MFIAWKAPWGLLLVLPLAAALGLAAAALGTGRPDAVLPSPRAGTPLAPMQKIAFHFPVDVETAEVTASPPLEGSVLVKGASVEFRPVEPMRPGAVYEFFVTASRGEERFSEAFAYPVMPLADELWVYARLDRIPHEVFVFRGDQPVRRMTASGGRPGYETPEGTFRVQNRGYHFFSQKYGEGAFYWVRIFGNYLFHSIPVDETGQVIREEAEKLGCPASHGCIRLGFEDAKWFYENVPDGALVVIDRT